MNVGCGLCVVDNTGGIECDGGACFIVLPDGLRARVRYRNQSVH